MKKFLVFFISCVFVFVAGFNLINVKEVHAAQCVGGSSNNPAGCTPVTGATNNSCPPNSNTLCNPLGNASVYTIIGRLISVVLGLVGSIALLMFIYGGVVWMTSAGAADRVRKGREAILWSVIGMAVIFASYGLTTFLINNITG